MGYLSADEFDTLFAVLRSTINGDPLQAERFAAGIRVHVPEVVEALNCLVIDERVRRPFPDMKVITAAQATIFDNWSQTGGRKPSKKKGEKGARAERFKVTTEVWTCSPPVQVGKGKARPFRLTSANAAFVGTAHLMDGPALRTKALTLRASFRKKGPEWEEYAEGLAQADQIASRRIGPIFTTWRGTHYHLGLVAYANEAALLARSGVRLVIASTRGELRFSDWATTYPDGAPLKGNAILTSRLTSIPQKKAWATRPIGVIDCKEDDPTY